jgi:hypothetical protein
MSYETIDSLHRAKNEAARLRSVIADLNRIIESQSNYIQKLLKDLEKAGDEHV